MTRKQRRLTLIGISGVILISAAVLVLVALEEQIVFFKTPTDILETDIPTGERFRLGGLVADGSFHRGDGTEVSFKVTDTENTLGVVFNGILPDLFREGQGVVLEGHLNGDGVFVAETVFAKHDENYLPKEVAESLREKGVWKGGESE